MLLSQIIHPDGSIGVVLRDGSEAALIRNAESTYALTFHLQSFGFGQNISEFTLKVMFFYYNSIRNRMKWISHTLMQYMLLLCS